MDSDKVKAVASFIKSEEDVIVPVFKDGDSYISLDGHSRLKYASNLNFDYVFGYLTKIDDFIFDFVKEAKRRKVTSPLTLVELSHSDCVDKWYDFCDRYFNSNNSF